MPRGAGNARRGSARSVDEGGGSPRMVVAELGVAIHIGTSGWSYSHWAGVLYPEGLPSNVAWAITSHSSGLPSG